MHTQHPYVDFYQYTMMNTGDNCPLLPVLPRFPLELSSIADQSKNDLDRFYKLTHVCIVSTNRNKAPPTHVIMLYMYSPVHVR